MNRLYYISLWIMVIVVASFMLYRVKYEVQSLKAQIADVSREVLNEREAMHVAAAEWAYLNRPERLKILADKYLAGKNVTVDQVAEIEAIAFHQKAMASADIGDAGMNDNIRSIIASYHSNSAQP